MSMVAYWAVNRQGLQEAATAAEAAGGEDGCDALQTEAEQDKGATTASKGPAANGDGCSGGGGGGGEANGRLGVSDTAAAEEDGNEDEGGGGEEGSVSQQERVFLGIVARYGTILSLTTFLNHSFSCMFPLFRILDT